MWIPCSAAVLLKVEGHLATIGFGTAAGTLARLLMLRNDYRQYPGYPHGYVIHLSLGFIAAALGAVAVPAIAEPDFTAVTFLALAAQQFREVRNMERRTLEKLEELELVKRGPDYIEGMARTFEARNYLAMGTALAVAAACQWAGREWAAAVAMLSLLASWRLMAGRTVGAICDVVPVPLEFRGALLTAAGVALANVGAPEMREKILREGLAVCLKPRDADARATLDDLGQRMAVAHTAAVILGTKNEIDLPELAPVVRKNIDTGELVLAIVPFVRDPAALAAAVRRAPVLESARSRPLRTGAGRAARRRG